MLLRIKTDELKGLLPLISAAINLEKGETKVVKLSTQQSSQGKKLKVQVSNNVALLTSTISVETAPSDNSQSVEGIFQAERLLKLLASYCKQPSIVLDIGEVLAVGIGDLDSHELTYRFARVQSNFPDWKVGRLDKIVSIPASVWKGMIGNVEFCCSEGQEIIRNLNLEITKTEAILYGVSREISAVASNEQNVVIHKAETNLVLSRQVKSLLSLLGKETELEEQLIFYSFKKLIKIVLGNHVLLFNTIEGTFPSSTVNTNLNNLDFPIIVNRLELQEVIERQSLIGSFPTITLTGSSLSIQQQQEVGSGSEAISIYVEEELGEPINLSLNIFKLQRVIKTIDSPEIRLSINKTQDNKLVAINPCLSQADDKDSSALSYLVCPIVA